MWQGAPSAMFMMIYTFHTKPARQMILHPPLLSLKISRTNVNLFKFYEFLQVSR